MAEAQTVQVQGLIDRLKAGDEAARQELIKCACDRLVRLTRKMLRSYPRVHRWEQTDDVFQNAAMRLYRALGEVKLEGPAQFYRLAAVNVRRELLDLAKHYYGPRGLGVHHQSCTEVPAPCSPEDSDQLAAWADFHAQVEHLPEEERETFDLLWYQGLSQAEAAGLLGISERTIKRRWQSARLALHNALGGALPGT
jgi:RNA polymerase sigma factor (sigma-70 family)